MRQTREFVLAGATACPRAAAHLTRREQIADVRSGVAVKDDWEVSGLTLREVFRPSIDTAFSVTVPKGTVVFRGRAAALEELMDQVDSLARRVFQGGDEQIVVVRPWQVGGGGWRVEEAPIPQGYCWDVVQYTPTPACRAAMLGDLGAIAALGPEEANEMSPVVGLTPMHHAAIAGSVPALEALVQRGASPSAANHMGLTPAMVSAICSRGGALAFLLGQGGVTGNEAEGQLGRGALHIACAYGVDECVSALLACPKVDPNLPAGDGTTPLWAAATFGHAGAAALVAGAGGADVERGFKGVTPLQVAVVKGHGEVVRALLGAGAAVPPLGDGTAMLEVAVGTKRDECVRALVSDAGVKAGVDPGGVLPGRGVPPLAFAVQVGSAGAVEALAGCGGAGVAWKDADGEGLLHMAVRRGDAGVLAAVLQAPGVDVNGRSLSGYSPLYMASVMGLEGAVGALCAAGGVDVELPDGDGWTPLHVAANKDHLGVARVLIGAGAKTDSVNQNAVPGDMAKSDEMRTLLGFTPKVVKSKPAPAPAKGGAAGGKGGDKREGKPKKKK